MRDGAVQDSPAGIPVQFKDTMRVGEIHDGEYNDGRHGHTGAA